MIFTVLLAIVIARIKKYSILPLFKFYLIYPLFAAELVNIFFQLCAIFGNYSFIKYAGLLKSIYLYILLIPIIALKLYKPALIGSLFIFAGTFMNKLVMHFNGGKMPVFPSLSLITGYIDKNSLNGVDNIHILGQADTKLKFLSDYIDVGYSVLSIGDLFIRAFVFIIIYFTIKELNKKLT